MSIKYEEYAKVNLDDLNVFFSGYAFNVLKEEKINSLKELFEAYDRNCSKDEVIKHVKTHELSSVYAEINANIKLLRYIYLGIDPEFDYDYELIDLGFSPRLAKCITRFGKYAIDEQMSEFETLKKIVEDKLFIRGVGKQLYKELMFKSKYLIEYFEEKTKKSLYIKTELENSELIDLYKELSGLLKESQLLNERIQSVQSMIIKKLENTEKPKQKVINIIQK